MKERNLKQTDDKWYVDFTAQGKRIRQFGGYTKAQARNTLAKLRIERLDKRLGFKKPEQRGTLFEDFAEEFIAKHSKGRPKTREAQAVCLRALLNSDLFKGKGLADITTESIARYHADRGADRPVSANREIGFLKQIFQRAVEWGELDRNPAALVKKFHEPKNRLRILTDEEVERLLNAAGPRLAPFLKVLLTTAMRPHEALALSWAHDGWDADKGLAVSIVDLEKRVIFIPARLAKNHKDRAIPLSPEHIALFDALPRNLKSGKVFPWSQTPVGFRAAVDAAKLKDVVLYTCKHTAASRMIRAGIDIVTVSELIGHSDPKMTLRYCHSSLETKQEAVNTLSRIYLQTPKPATETVAPRKMSEHRFLSESLN
jgi:integrase